MMAEDEITFDSAALDRLDRTSEIFYCMLERIAVGLAKKDGRLNITLHDVMHAELFVWTALL